MLGRFHPLWLPPMGDPNAQLVTLSYTKGTVTGTLGLLSYLFGTKLGDWVDNAIPPASPGGRRRRRYGTRQRSNARAGKPIFLRLKDGGVFTVRVTGADLDFLPRLAAAGDKVVNAWTPRGTIYGPKPIDTVIG